MAARDVKWLMRVHAVINRRAGTMIGQDTAVVQRTIEEAFQRHGHSATAEFVDPPDLLVALKRAADGPCDTILVGGGDGSVKTAAAICIEKKRALGILPLGTLNRMARDLGIPLDLAGAIEALAAGHTQQIDVASVNDRLFLGNSLMGLPPHYSEQRQKLRGRPLLERVHGYVSVVKTILSSRKRLQITVDSGDDRRQMRVLSLAVTNNPYDKGPSIGLTRPRLDSGKLAIYASRHRTGWSMARAVIRAVFGRWRGDPYMSHFLADEVVVHMARPRIRLANDGEVEHFVPPLRYKIHPKALTILVPSAVAGADPVDKDAGQLEMQEAS